MLNIQWEVFEMKRFFFLLIPLSLLADGIIIPHPPPVPGPPPYLNLINHKVVMDIKDNVLDVSLEELFQNPYRRRIEGDYIFPLPRNAIISGFKIRIGDRVLEGEVYEKDEARRLYEEMVEKLKDPSLLEYYRDNLFRARIFPIPPREEVGVKVRYQQVLPKVSQFWCLRYPMRIEGLTKEPIKELSISINLETREPIKSIFSPSHEIEIKRVGERKALIKLEAKKVKPQKDFLLYYSTSKDILDVGLISYKKRDEDGYFLLTISPGFYSREKLTRKDIVFVIDVSGSMSGRKIKSAKEALKYVLRHLEEKDKFGIIAFSSDITKFREKLVEAKRRDIEKAIDFIENLVAEGGTNIYEALRAALSLSGKGEEPSYIVFLTDGKPTVGITDLRKIVEDVKKEISGTRIFVFGVGYEVNTHLLDLLSQVSKGTSVYVEPEEDLEIILTDFYEKIAHPALTDLEIELGGVGAYHLEPRELPDLFYGSELVVVGRYRKAGEYEISCSGKFLKEKIEVSKVVKFEEENSDADFIPRIWANRRVAYLLNQIRLHGEEKELVDEIISLGEEYGIVTPYTSYLVREEERLLSPQLTQREALFSKTGKLATKAAKQIIGMREKIVVPSEEVFKSIKRVGEKTFYLRENIWIDSSYREGMKEVKIPFLSEKYIKLLRERPEISKYLSVGTNVKIVIGEKVYWIHSPS